MSIPNKSEKTKLDKTKQSEIKEKLYTTKQVETSITLLESPENDVVLEALLFLSKYIDIHANNIVYVVKRGIISKLVTNFHKNICILRLSLRLLSCLLDTEDAIYEIDQDKYDSTLIEITNMYIEHKDNHVKEFCIETLAKVATSSRINTLIFKVDLLNPIFDNLKSSKNPNIQYHTLWLFFRLMDAPAAISALPESKNFDPNLILLHLNHSDSNISNLVLDIVEKLTNYGLPLLQELFKKISLVEKMLKLVMDESHSDQHDKVIKIIHNCLQSEETSFYYIESLEFLEFCQWIKTCHPKFLLPMIDVFIKLTSIPEIKQILFDLSVEDSILCFFRYMNKAVINKTCQAVINMTTHKYCCREMLTPIIATILLEILERQNDDEDLHNEVALETVFCFVRRNHLALGIFLEKGLKPILLNYFFIKSKLISKESFLMVLEILFRYMANPTFQEEFISKEIILELFRLFQTSSAEIATLCGEMLSCLTSREEFRRLFLELKGPKVFIEVLDSTENIDLLTQIVYFIFSCLIYEDVAMAFLNNGLIKSLKNFSNYFICKIPIIQKVKHLAINYYLPLKFYETGTLEITDKLPNKFYVINGPWSEPFPFLEILEAMYVSPYQTIYLVDYSYEVFKEDKPESASQSSLRASLASLSTNSTSTNPMSMSGDQSRSSISTVPSIFDINYGRISKDPYLPRYIFHIKKFDYFLKGNLQDRIRFLAEYVDTLLCGPKEKLSLPQKIHEYKLHIECIKEKLGNNIVPIGYLRLGFHCERALLFKALADKIGIPCSLVKGNLKIYWNEIALFDEVETNPIIKFYVVDLLEEMGNLMLVGSREANKYCNLH